MVMKKLTIFLLFLLVLPMAFSAKVTQTFTGGDIGLELRIPPAEFIEFGQDSQLNIHVFNKSSGLVMDNTTTGCIIHIFNKTGSHVLNRPFNFDDTERDFTINIASGNFTYLGFHSFIVQCNTSTEGGFVSGSVIVTTSGEEEITTDTTAVMIAIVLFGLLLIILGSVMLLRRER